MSTVFELEYNSVVNKNKNLFYFNNYCTDYKEFKEWLNHNDISIEEFESLNDNIQDIYLLHKANHIIDCMQECLKGSKSTFEDKLKIMKNYYNACKDNLYYIEILANIKNDVSYIFSSMINDMHEIADTLDEQ